MHFIHNDTTMCGITFLQCLLEMIQNELCIFKTFMCELSHTTFQILDNYSLLVLQVYHSSS